MLDLQLGHRAARERRDPLETGLGHCDVERAFEQRVVRHVAVLRPAVAIAEQRDKVRPTSIYLQKTRLEHLARLRLFARDTPPKVDEIDEQIGHSLTQRWQHFQHQQFALTLHVDERRTNKNVHIALRQRAVSTARVHRDV